MKKISLSLCWCVLVYVSAFAQPIRGLSVGVNPLSFAESQLSLGPCIGYRITPRIGLWTELSYIFANSYMPKEWTKMSGARFIFQGRYYTGDKKNFFIAPEFRFKSYSFHDRLTFINVHSSDTLADFGFRENQLLVGGALVFGKQISLPGKKNMFLEITLGLGAKDRYINYHKVPAEYQPYLFRPSDGGLSPNYEYADPGRVYVPMSCRFFWRLR